MPEAALKGALHKKGEKEPNPDYQFYQGYGNMDTLGAPPLLLPDRFCEVIMAKINEHASECVRAFNFQAEPNAQVGDPMVVYNTADDFIAMIKAAPDSDSDSDDGNDKGDKQAWKATIEARLSAIEAKLGLVSLAEPDAQK